MKHQKEENKITYVVRKTKLWTKEQFGRRKASLDVFDTLHIRAFVTWLRLRQVDISSCYNSAVRVAHLLRVDKLTKVLYIRGEVREEFHILAVFTWS